MKNKTHPDTLASLGACSDARDWINSRRFESLESAWLKCERGDWMLWYAADAADAAARKETLTQCAAARKETLKQCADIVRKHFPQLP